MLIDITFAKCLRSTAKRLRDCCSALRVALQWRHGLEARDAAAPRPPPGGSPSPSVSGVHISASSHRNRTGHWITKATLTRSSSRDVANLEKEERPFHFDMDVSRQSCGDDETMAIALHVVAPPARVGADYKFFPNIGCYKLHTAKTNWEDARQTCEREGAHLAVVNSEAEENAIREVITPRADKGAFIGFHDMFKEGEYVTFLGEPLNSTGHVRWKEGQPDNWMAPHFQGDEDCGNIGLDGTINDIRCSEKMPFVCEQAL